MRSGVRLSERWFNAALWLVAIVFASFLIGLGSLLVGDLPRVEQTATLEQFLDHDRAAPIEATLKTIHRDQADLRQRMDQTQLTLNASRSATAAAQETFANWLKTRAVTQRLDQDPELIARTTQLDGLKAAERIIERQSEDQAKAELDLSQREAEQSRADDELRAAAANQLSESASRQELRVFGYRLLLTVPLLILAGWLLLKQRNTRNWPFVWGFAFFAIFVFFVELVPYLPSYGGYVQYGIGVLATLIGGRTAINAYQAYLERQKAAESRPDAERRTEIATDQALVRLSKKACPGCERPIDLTDPSVNFCPHCGIGVFDHCPRCDHRKSTFNRFCPTCGERAVEPNLGTGFVASQPV